MTTLNKAWVDASLDQADNERAKISEKEREIIALKQTNSYDEIAEDLDIKTGTLRQMFSRAKEKFMRCMGFLDE